MHLLVDGFGGREFVAELMDGLIAGGVNVLIYRREVGLMSLRRRRLRRLHRKLAVIDGEIAFVGGINIIDDLNTAGQSQGRYDYAVRVDGPVLRPIRQSMRRIWEVLVWVNICLLYTSSCV